MQTLYGRRKTGSKFLDINSYSNIEFNAVSIRPINGHYKAFIRPLYFVDGFCWVCPFCPNHRHSIRKDSILHNRNISLFPFLHVLWHNCNTISTSQAAEQESLCPKTVRSILAAIRHCMIDDLLTTPLLLGGPGARPIPHWTEDIKQLTDSTREVAVRRCRAREQ